MSTMNLACHKNTVMWWENVIFHTFLQLSASEISTGNSEPSWSPFLCKLQQLEGEKKRTTWINLEDTTFPWFNCRNPQVITINVLRILQRGSSKEHVFSPKWSRIKPNASGSILKTFVPLLKNYGVNHRCTHSPSHGLFFVLVNINASHKSATAVASKWIQGKQQGEMCCSRYACIRACRAHL